MLRVMTAPSEQYRTRERVAALPVNPSQAWLYWRVAPGSFERATLRVVDANDETRLQRPVIEAEGEHFLSLDPYTPWIDAMLTIVRADGSTRTLSAKRLYMPPIASAPVYAPDVRTGEGPAYGSPTARALAKLKKLEES